MIRTRGRSTVAPHALVLLDDCLFGWSDSLATLSAPTHTFEVDEIPAASRAYDSSLLCNGHVYRFSFSVVVSKFLKALVGFRRLLAYQLYALINVLVHVDPGVRSDATVQTS